MRYSAEHIQRTRARILREALRLFRQRGYQGASIDDVMAAAKLTRGSFYHHFDSKEALFAEVFRLGGNDFVGKLEARRATTPEGLVDEAVGIARAYLAPENRDIVRQGCPLAALPVDAARCGELVRAAFGEKLSALAGEMQRGSPRSDDDLSRALAAIALCIGGVVLSSAVADKDLADKLSRACQDAAENALRSGADAQSDATPLRRKERPKPRRNS